MRCIWVKECGLVYKTEIEIEGRPTYTRYLVSVPRMGEFIKVETPEIDLYMPVKKVIWDFINSSVKVIAGVPDIG